jgi:hypothetical protein
MSIGTEPWQLAWRRHGLGLRTTAVVLVAEPGGSILTSDPRDIQHLVDTTHGNVRVVAC